MLRQRSRAVPVFGGWTGAVKRGQVHEPTEMLELSTQHDLYKTDRPPVYEA